MRANHKAGGIYVFCNKEGPYLFPEIVISYHACNMYAQPPAFKSDHSRGGRAAAVDDQISEFALDVRCRVGTNQTEIIKRALTYAENDRKVRHVIIL